MGPRSLWVFHRGEVPAEVSRIDLATGRRQVWKKLSPPNSSGVYSIIDFKVTRDVRAYFYSYKRVLSQLLHGQRAGPRYLPYQARYRS